MFSHFIVKLYSKLTDDEVEALREARMEAREKNWGKLFKVSSIMEFRFMWNSRVEFVHFYSIAFQRYDVPGNIDDVVDWDDEGGDDDASPENEDFDESIEADGIDIERGKENIGDSDAANLMSIEVSSDDEEQQEFYGVFQKVFEMRLLEF